MTRGIGVKVPRGNFVPVEGKSPMAGKATPYEAEELEPEDRIVYWNCSAMLARICVVRAEEAEAFVEVERVVCGAVICGRC